MNKLVSVICLCFNQRKFLESAIESVMSQSYEHVELIIVDDNSQDGSREMIERIIRKYKNIKSYLSDKSLGNCRAFNRGLSLARGDYIIDLAADDILLPERIAEGIDCLEISGEEYGINYTDAEYIKEDGTRIKSHFKRDRRGILQENIPRGFIYEKLLARYFICTPTMMIRRSVFEKIGGYDEDLAYEDFDFWIRTGKLFKYCFTDKILVQKRLLKNSLSTRQYSKNSEILQSTLRVCQKAEEINENDKDRMALLIRARYEFRKAVFSGNPEVARDFGKLIIRNTRNKFVKIYYRFLLNFV